MIISQERRRIDRVLRQEGRPALSDREWSYGQEHFPVEESLADGDISNFVLEIVDARKAFGADTKVEAVELQRGVPQGRQRALSLLLADLARADPEVIEFRSKHLNGEPLSVAAIKEWGLQEAATEGPPTRWASEVALGRNTKLQFDDSGTCVRIDGEVRCGSFAPRTLDFPTPERSVETVPISADGVLHELHRISCALAREFRWNEAEALTFILTDEVPPVHPAMGQFEVSHLPCLSRIILTVDPALSPGQVRTIYRRFRGRAQDDKYKNISSKHATLAAFTAQNSELKLKDQMRKWNQCHPQWAYNQVTNFGRDAKTACGKLLAPPNLSLKSVLSAASSS